MRQKNKAWLKLKILLTLKFEWRNIKLSKKKLVNLASIALRICTQKVIWEMWMKKSNNNHSISKALHAKSNLVYFEGFFVPQKRGSYYRSVRKTKKRLVLISFVREESKFSKKACKVIQDKFFVKNFEMFL